MLLTPPWHWGLNGSGRAGTRNANPWLRITTNLDESLFNMYVKSVRWQQTFECCESAFPNNFRTTSKIVYGFTLFNGFRSMHWKILVTLFSCDNQNNFKSFKTSNRKLVNKVNQFFKARLSYPRLDVSILPLAFGSRKISNGWMSVEKLMKTFGWVLLLCPVTF